MFRFNNDGPIALNFHFNEGRRELRFLIVRKLAGWEAGRPESLEGRKQLSLQAFQLPGLQAMKDKRISLPAVLSTLPFSSIKLGVHASYSNAPVFSAPAVLIDVSEPQKWLVDDGGLFVYSINRFHFLFPLNRSNPYWKPEACDRNFQPLKL